MRKLVSVFGVAVLMLWFSAGKELRAQNILLTPDTQKQEVAVVFGDAAEKEFSLTVNVNQNKWRLIKFNKIPGKTWIKLASDAGPYVKGEEIAPNQWYAFKKTLALILTVDAEAGGQVQTNGQTLRELSLTYEFGAPKGTGASYLEHNEDQVKQFTTNPENISPKGGDHLLLFKWQVVIPDPSPSPTGTPVKSLSGIGLIAIPITVISLGLIALVVFLFLRNRRSDLKQESRPDLIGNLGMSEDREYPKVSSEVVDPSPPPVDIIERLREMERPSPPPAAPVDITPPAPGPDTAPRASEEIDEPWRQVDEKLKGESELVQLISDDLRDTQQEIAQLKATFQGDIERLKSDVATVSSLKTSIDFLVKENSKYGEANLRQQDFENRLIQLTEQDHRFQQDIDFLKNSLKEWKHLNGINEGMVGVIVGNSVESLHEENFNAFTREVEEYLNRLVRDDVPSSDDFKELEQQAVSVSEAFQTAFQRICAAQPQMESKLRPYLDHANQIASDLKHFSSQLKSRQLNFNIRVSAHAGARDPFLAELGSAIKRELDKLRDPRAFWKHELERLATSHVIPVVDIYDKEIARSHSSDGEIEKSLNALFVQTGLSPIRPQPGEPFKPADQNLIQMVAGPAGNSQKIARVFSRGFNYTDKDGNKRLIRKAGVEIYR